MLINSPVLLLTKSPAFFIPVASPGQAEEIKAQAEGTVKTGILREEILLHNIIFFWTLWEHFVFVPCRSRPDKSQQCKTSVYKGASYIKCHMETLPRWWISSKGLPSARWTPECICFYQPTRHTGSSKGSLVVTAQDVFLWPASCLMGIFQRSVALTISLCCRSSLAVHPLPPLPSAMALDVFCSKQPERAWKTEWQHGHPKKRAQKECPNLLMSLRTYCFLYQGASQKKWKKYVACIGERNQDQVMVCVLSIFQLLQVVYSMGRKPACLRVYVSAWVCKLCC